jgi:hypothetical protein
MNNNTSQSASNLLNEELLIASTNLAKVVPLHNNRFDNSKQAPIQVTEQHNTIIRRHSFDDNGGGYEGL